MLIRGSDLLQTPVMSLQTGTELATTKSFVIDPADLGILAFELEGDQLTDDPTLLRIQDIRELSSIGFIVDSSDEFISKGFVIKINEIYNLQFSPYGMKVIDTNNKTVGRVTDIVIDSNTFLVEQLAIKRPLLQRINTTEILIGRQQIAAINNDNIVVKAPTIKSGQSNLANSAKIFTNPFRETKSPKPVTSSKEVS